MFDLIKPGHVLRFGTCPSTINSPPAGNAATNDNTLETLWPNVNNLGLVQCLSHPSGNLGKVAADVAIKLRGESKFSRTVSYSELGRAFTASNRLVGNQNCRFVGYTDGKSFYIQTADTVFSKDFSGCLFVAYRVGGNRRVAHVAASAVAAMDCKQAFLTTVHGIAGAQLIGWFRPYIARRDDMSKISAYHQVKEHIPGQDINKLTTFGVMTQAGAGYSIDAFKPTGVVGADWVVTAITQRTLSRAWFVHHHA